MRIFHSLVFEQNVEGTASVNSDPVWNSQLGAAEKVMIYGVTDTVSGTSPTLTVQLEESPDQIHWSNKFTVAEITTSPLATNANSTAAGRDNGANVSSGFVRLKVTLGGTAPKAHVKLWVTGRGEQGGG